MRSRKIFGNLLIRLKRLFNRKPSSDYQFKILEEKLYKLQDSLSTFQNSLGVVAKFSVGQVSKQTKNEEIQSGILGIVNQHESEIENFKKLLNQHADVINILRKHVYKDVLLEEPKKELDESLENNSLLDINKKFNKDN